LLIARLRKARTNPRKPPPPELCISGDPWCVPTADGRLRCYKFCDSGCYYDDKARIGRGYQSVDTEGLNDFACPCSLKEYYYREADRRYRMTIDARVCPPAGARQASTIRSISDGLCAPGTERLVHAAPGVPDAALECRLDLLRRVHDVKEQGSTLSWLVRVPAGDIACSCLRADPGFDAYRAAGGKTYRK
jgi:hypothetical protein